MIKKENETFYRNYLFKSRKCVDGGIVFESTITALKEPFTRIGNILSMIKKSQRASVVSEEIPTHNEGLVKIVVGDNFDEEVTNSNRDAFIEFYSPHCKYCQEFEPTWDQLGEQMKNEDLDIMKMNVATNAWDDELYHIPSLPTIYWKFADRNKSPIQYNNPRTITQFIKFAAANATTELKGWDREGKPKRRKL